MVFTVNEAQKVRLEVVALLSAEFIGFRNLYKGFGAYPYYRWGKSHVQVHHIRRMDSYAGLCEEIALFHGVKAEFCLCRELHSVLEVSPANLEYLLRSRYIPVRGQDCAESCKDIAKTCTDDYSFSLSNNCAYMRSLGLQDCVFTEDSAAPYVRGQTGYVATEIRQEGVRCLLNSTEDRVCQCLK